VLAQGHPRARPLTIAQIDSIDLDRALSIYRERLGDASDFTFVLVGKIDADSLRPLITRYLGSLPAGGGKTGWRDNGIRPPSGVVEKTFRFGVEPRARTTIIFDGPFTDDLSAPRSLNALARVLQTRLRERLREQLGATYSVGVQVATRSIPERRYRVSIGFDAAPESIDELTTAVFAEVEALRKSGPTKEEVQKVREESLRQLELAWKNNQFWLQTITGYTMMDRPLEDISAYDKPFRELNAARMHEMARKYLDSGQYVRVTQLPAQ
jgi:zinc protease